MLIRIIKQRNLERLNKLIPYYNKKYDRDSFIYIYPIGEILSFQEWIKNDNINKQLNDKDISWLKENNISTE